MNKRLALGVIPAVALIAIALPMVAFWGDLPNPIATHWTLSGEPDGSMPPALLLVVIGGVFAAMWVAVWRAAAQYPFEAPSFAAGLAGAGGLLASVSWITVLANRRVTDWADAGEFTALHIVALVAATAGVGFIGWTAAGGTRRPIRPDGPRPTIDLAADETAVWSGSGRGPLLIFIGLGLLVTAVAVWSWTSIVLAVIAVVVLAFAQVRATVSERGVLISLGWLGVPSWTVPMHQIGGAETEDVRPMSFGGWGYRLRPGVRAIVVRGGPSLRIVRPDAPDLLITVDDAETAAAVVNTLRSRVT